MPGWATTALRSRPIARRWSSSRTSWKAQLYLGNALLRLGQRAEAIEAYRQFLGVGEDGEAAERIRRILKQIAPQALPDFEPALDADRKDEGS